MTLAKFLLGIIAVSSIAIASSDRCDKTLTEKDVMNTEARYKTDKSMASLYANGYDVFLKRTNFREKIGLAVENYLTTHATRLNQLPTIRILEIGCGNGEMTAMYLKALRKTAPNAKIVIDLIEPAEGALKQAFENVLAADSKTEVNAVPKPMDEFVQSEGFRHREYDWMIASYVFYHVSPTVIPALLGRLSTGGFMTIAMGSPNHPLRAPSELKALSKHGDSKTVDHILSTEVSVTQFGRERQVIPTDVNLNGLWNQTDGFSADGVSYFSFVYNNDLSGFSTAQKSALENLLSTVHENQGGLVHPEHHLFWVWKK